MTGIEVDIDKKYRDLLGDVAPTGYITARLDSEGIINYQVEVGDLRRHENLHEPGYMKIDDRFYDMVSAFMDDDFEKCDELAELCFDYELEVCGADPKDPLSESERNTEYVIFKERDSVFQRALAENNREFFLLLPTKGSLSRVLSSGLKSCLRLVYFSDDWGEEYKNVMEGICDKDGIKYEYISVTTKLDLDKFYYCSFSYTTAKHFKLKKFMALEPNIYMVLSNDLSIGVEGDEDGYSVSYTRDKRERSVRQNFRELNKVIYGADSLGELYENSSYRKGCMMHDIYCDSNYSDININVSQGSAPVANAVCLIGNYRHVGNKIYCEDELIHVNDGRNMCCKDNSNHWLALDNEGDRLMRASYVIGMFASVAYHLGDKIYVKRDDNSRECVIGDTTYKRVSVVEGDPYVRFFNGEMIYKKERYTKVPRISFTAEISALFGRTEFTYGTYHNLIRRNIYKKKDTGFVEEGDEIKEDIPDTFTWESVVDHGNENG